MRVTAQDIVSILHQQRRLVLASQWDGWLRGGLDRALMNEVATLEQKAKAVAARERVDPFAFVTVACSRYAIWATHLAEVLRSGIAEDYGHAAPAADVAQESIMAFAAGQRLVEQANEALGRLAAGHPQPEYESHLQVYGTPGLPAFECSWIDFRLLAGRNPLTALDARWLMARGVTHVLDLREPWEWEGPGRYGKEALDELGRPVCHVPVRDMQAPTPDQFTAAVKFLEESLSDPRAVVYVHCRAGKERTAAILVAYCARRYRLTYDQALQQLRARRNLVPLRDQERAAREWLRHNA